MKNGQKSCSKFDFDANWVLRPWDTRAPEDRVSSYDAPQGD